MGFRPGWPGAHARRRLGLLVSGAAGALAFPTGDWSLFAWVWLVPVLVSASERSPRGALGDGWLAGLSFFLVLLRWLDHTFQGYSAIPWPLTWLPIAALAAYCGLYVGAMAAVVSWLGSRLGRGWGLAAAPGLWVAGEWIRGWLMGGFPWGLLGYSQHRALAVIQIAEIGGVYAVSLLIVAVNAALASWCVLGFRRSAPGITTAAVLAAGSLAFGWWVLAHEYGPAARPPVQSIEVAVIQPAIAQSLKWDPAHQAEALDRYERLTREAARSKPAVILWPETAAPIFLRGDPVLLLRLTALSAELGAPILVGSIDRLPGPRAQFLNSAFLLGEQGIRAKYDKIHLVPFGEYVPLAGLIGFVRSWAEFISDFAAGNSQTVFELPGAPFGTVICYEVIFPELFRDFVVGGASFMANITNDAWFGRTSGPWQHLGTLPLRAVENRVAIARAANTGISGFVSPSGMVGPIMPLFERGYLSARVAQRARTTLYTRWGDWLPYLCLALSGIAAGTAFRRRAA
ncbi:MAG TPA: apolipoprotein N-acyltransferase [Methylomirabilota bacterium]|nr:apolipoprotein N-acyltransferase [Methylomirabilota bacterium]